MGIQREFQAALKSQFGPATNYAATGLLAATEVLISSVPCVVYGISLNATATIAPIVRLVDATATAQGTAATWGIAALPIGGIDHDFVRPLRFDKGLVLSYTASGAATVSANIQWSPWSF